MGGQIRKKSHMPETNVFHMSHMPESNVLNMSHMHFLIGTGGNTASEPILFLSAITTCLF